ncbi:MAG: hypothetical protein PHH54_01320 [Candidatus Nanoarchaeia archaeon]|nr:hypothetical protein [Candidatus Nanoarchaeia archaeon]MDD5740603.1 hypothetical protein [Candidatus Nanoarchaeia archaeon]
MRTGLFLPKEFENSELLVKDMADKHGVKIDEDNKKCLCEVNNLDDLNKYTSIITHPHKNEECYEKIARIIESKPEIQFYMIAFMAEKRIKIVSEHANLEYITENSKEPCFQKL